MNNEQQNTDERFSVEELKYGGFSICDREATDEADEVCYYRTQHPYAKKAAEAERDRLNAWNKEGGNIRPLEVQPKPRRLPLVFGEFSDPTSLTLTVDEKRRYLAEIFRSPEFTDHDKFTALQEDNRMLAMFGLGNGKEQE